MAAYPPGPPPPYGAQPPQNYGPPPHMAPHPQWAPPPPQPHPYNGPPPRQQQFYNGPPPPTMPPQQPYPHWQNQQQPQPPMPPGPQIQILPTPHLIFTGPQSTSLLSTSKATISLLNPQTNQPQPTHHVKQSKRSKPQLTISRLDPSGAPTPHPIGTATFSSLSSSITLSLPSSSGISELKLKTDHWSSTSTKEFNHPLLGPLVWKSNSLGGKWELRDAQKRVLARYRDDSLGLSRKAARIEIFVAGGDDSLVDMVLCSAVAVVKGEEKEAKKALDVLGEVL